MCAARAPLPCNTSLVLLPLLSDEMKLEKEDETLGSNDTVEELTLVSSMDRLSLQYPENLGLREVERHLARVALHDQDSDDTSSEHQTDEEGETGREKDVNDKLNEEKDEVKVEVQEDEEEVKEEVKEEVQEDEIKKEMEKDKKVTKEEQKDEKEVKKEVVKDEEEVEKEEQDDEEEVKKEEQEEDHSDDENPTDEDEGASSGAKKTSKLLRRGWGPSDDTTPYLRVQQDDALYNYGVYDTAPGHMYNYSHNDVVAPASNGLITQYEQSPQYGLPPHNGQLSPQYGQSPGYPDMSPVHRGATDPSMYNMLPTLQHGQPPYYPDMSPVHSEGMGGMNYSLPPVSGVDGCYYGYSENGSPYIIPESPPISSPDENENYQYQGLQSSPPSPEQDLDQFPSVDQHNLDQVLEVVHQVVNNNEISSAPPSAIEMIIMKLTDEIGTPATDLTQEMRTAATNEWSYNEEPSQPVLDSCLPLQPTVDCCNVSPYHEQGVVEQTPDTKWKMTQNPRRQLEARRILARRTNEELIAKDADGDTPIMILACRNVNDDGYAESLVAIVDRVEGINVCCDMVVNKTGRCNNCGNTAPVKFYSPLSMKNNEGDTVLSSVVKMRHPVSVINYIVEKISHHPNDLRRIFDRSSLNFYFEYRHLYPALAQFFCE